ncbi:MAG TPA: AMP-binding protein [Polyangiaceae bacterium]
MTLSVFDAAREEPESIALVAGTTTVTYGDLAERVERRLGELAAAGALDETGERPVAVVMTPTLETVETLFALFAAGTPALLLHTRGTQNERARLVERAGAVLDPPDGSGDLPKVSLDERLDRERIAVIVPTSGTTGTPKLARLSHRALLAAAHGSAAHLGVEPDDRWLVALPLAHVSGLSILTRSLVARRTVVLFDPDGPLFQRLDPLARALADHDVTLVSLVPAVLDRLLAEPVSFHAGPKLRAVLLGGAPAPRELLVRAHGRGVPVLTTYGLTETCAQVATRPYAERFTPPPDGDLVPAGVPLPGVLVHAVGGVIEVRGPTLFSGYVGEAASNPRGGWFRTRDRGHFDANGALVVTGRTTDVVITGGENVDPAEVEAALVSVPGIDAACVLGLPDPTFGEAVAALIVTSGEAPRSVEAIRRALAQRLAPYKLPRRVAVVEALPTLASGKLDRPGARALADASFRPSMPPPGPRNPVTVPPSLGPRSRA